MNDYNENTPEKPEPPPRPKRLPEDDAALLRQCRVDVYRAGGAGGQHVNTSDSAVRLTHYTSGIVVTCSDTRSQHENKFRALQKLRKRYFDMFFKVQKARKETKPTRGSKERRITGKKQRGDLKKQRRQRFDD